jgi:hypothetical protein
MLVCAYQQGRMSHWDATITDFWWQAASPTLGLLDADNFDL